VEAVRAADGGDVAALARLYRQARAEMEPARGGAIFVVREGRAEPLEDGFEADLSRPTARVWVGTIDDQVVGYAVAEVERLRDGTNLGVTPDLFVESEAREVGVGEVLMGSAVAWLREQDCVGIDALALPGDRQTKNFFEGAGFSARLLVMHKKL
jgi:GNAT superfamily N-acetyltransferase